MKRFCLAVLLVSCACSPNSGFDGDAASALKVLERDGHVVDAKLAGGAVRYLGYSATPALAAPGTNLTLKHYWACEKALDRDYQVFVHFLLEGANGWVKNGDHTPELATTAWQPGMVVVTRHDVKLPDYLPGDALDMRVGLFAGEQRLPIEDRARDDGTRRILAGRLAVAGTPVPKPSYDAQRMAKAPVIDGRVDDAAWKGMPGIEGFTKSRGDAPARVQTNAVVGWDDANLYVAFTTRDPDIRGTMTKHDEPIYREETVEMFIATGEPGSYVELQSNPRGVTFDASFEGGPRRNMKTAYDADFQAACVIKGTIDDPTDTDEGWSCEWRVGVESIPGATVPPAPDSTWRVNFFRVAKDAPRHAGSTGDDRLVGDESAWSPPLMGDFHNLERFGTLVFRASVGDVEHAR